MSTTLLLNNLRNQRSPQVCGNAARDRLFLPSYCQGPPRRPRFIELALHRDTRVHMENFQVPDLLASTSTLSISYSINPEEES